MPSDRHAHVGLGEHFPFEGGGEDAGAERLGQHQRIARSGADGAHHLCRVDQAGDRQADLWLIVVDGVAADDNGAGFLDLFDAATQDLDQDGAVEAGRKADQGEGRQRPCAHGVDVGESVGGGDAAVAARIVDHRGEEIDGLHQRPLAVEAVDPGIGKGDSGGEEVFILEDWKLTQHLRQRPGGQLGGSTAGAGEAGQTDGLLGHGGHLLSKSRDWLLVTRNW
jgi:hypothetical protein